MSTPTYTDDEKNNNKSPHKTYDPLDLKAIAVKRDNDKAVPKIKAKGSGYNAEKILDIAFLEGVKVRQDKDLTNLLDAFDVESPVPLEALNAVSLILERVYAVNRDLNNRQHSGPIRGGMDAHFIKPSSEDDGIR